MILRHSNKKRGQSLVELIALTMFILAAFLVFQKYIVRAFSGRWKAVGSSLGQGRIYDPKATTECASNVFFQDEPSIWYDQKCFEDYCVGECLKVTKGRIACRNCLSNTCANSLCDDIEGYDDSR